MTDVQESVPSMVSGSLIEWLDQILSRSLVGHSLRVADSPSRRCFGFVDLDDGAVFELSLTKLKEQMGSEVFLKWCEAHGVDSDAMRTALRIPEGRAVLTSGKFFPPKE